MKLKFSRLVDVKTIMVGKEKKKKKTIFTVTNIPVTFDLGMGISTRLLLTAGSGHGKSYAERVIIELMAGKVQQIIIDLEGEYNTLREKFDFLWVGDKSEGADIEISIKIAGILANKIMEHKTDAILDVSELEKHEQKIFVKRFLDAMIELPKNLRSKVWVWVDEAHIYAPQSGKSESSRSVIDIGSRGRKRGQGSSFLTQRLSKLDKDVVAECKNIMIGGTGYIDDMKRMAEAAGLSTKEEMYQIREWKKGMFYILGPAFSQQGVLVMIDECKTTHLDPSDNKIKKVKTTSSAKVKKVLSKLADLPEEAQKELKTIKEHKGKIRELTSEVTVLKRKLNSDNKGMVDSKEIIALNKEKGILLKEVEKRDKILKESHETIAHASSLIKDMDKAFKEIPSFITIHTLNKCEKAMKTINDKPVLMALPVHKEIKSTQEEKDKFINENVEALDKSKESKKISDGDINLGRCERKIYSFLYSNQERASFTKVQIGVVTGYSPKSAAFKKALSTLGTNDLISRNGNNVSIKNINPDLVEEGHTFSIDLIKQKIEKCAKEILNVLLDYPDEELSKEDLAGRTSSEYISTQAAFKKGLSQLCSLGLAKRHGANVRLTEGIKEMI